MNLPVKYTEQDIEKAKRNSRYLGWVQGGAAVFLGGMVLNLLGWIPTILVVGGVSYLGYKILSSSSDDDS